MSRPLGAALYSGTEAGEDGGKATGYHRQGGTPAGDAEPLGFHSRGKRIERRAMAAARRGCTCCLLPLQLTEAGTGDARRGPAQRHCRLLLRYCCARGYYYACCCDAALPSTVATASFCYLKLLLQPERCTAAIRSETVAAARE